MRTHATVLAAALLLAGCAPKFDGPEKITGLRLLSVKAQPPELGAALDASGAGWPASSAAIQSLVGHPAFAAGDETVHGVVLHVACTPTPGNPQGTVCTQISALSQPSELLQHVLADPGAACSGGGVGAEEAITFSGLEACSRSGCGQLSVPPDPASPGSVVGLPTPRYQLPADYSIGALPAGHPQRVLGTDVVDLAVTLEAGPADLAPAAAVPSTCPAVLQAVLGQLQALWPARAHVVSLKWIHVRGPDMPAGSSPNLNPQVDGITLGGTALPPLTQAPLAVPADRDLTLLPVVNDYPSLVQTYQRFDTDGNYLDTRQEEWAYSWFSTAGTIDQSHTQSLDEANTYTTSEGRALMWLVVRDLRGGEAWTAGEVQAGP